MTTPATAIDWRTRARNLAIRGEAWIDGRYVPAASGATFDSLSPIDGRRLAQVASSDAVDVDRLSERVQRASVLIRFCRDRIATARVEIDRVVADLDPDSGG